MFLEAKKKALTHETVYPYENSPFSEVCESYSEQDRKLISKEFLFVYDLAGERNREFDFPFFEEVEPELVSAMTALYGRA